MSPVLTNLMKTTPRSPLSQHCEPLLFVLICLTYYLTFLFIYYLVVEYFPIGL